MATIDLKKVLEAEEFAPGETICPLMSRFIIVQPPMASEPALEATTVTCVAERCGMYRACQTKGVAP